MTDILEILKEDYQISVLPHLLPNVDTKNLGCYMHGLSGNEYNIALSPETLLCCAPEYKPTENQFIHFTSLKSLSSIISEKSIRLYSLLNSNDPNEYNYFAEFFQLKPDGINKFKKRVFLLSLCSDNILKTHNILNLWRLYGDNGLGVIIVFEIETSLIPFSKYLLANVLYKRPDSKNFIKKNREFEKRFNLKVDYSDLLHIQACLHKSKYFQAEEEVRLVYLPSHIPSYYNSDNDQFGFDINKWNEEVSYHKIMLNKKKNTNTPNIRIKQVQFGFRYSTEEFDRLKNHFHLLFFRASKIDGNNVQIPKLEHSPLKNIYR